MPGLTVALTAAVSLALLGGVAAWLARAIRGGRLHRNATVGMRTAATTASDEAWDAGHQAALPGLVATRRSALGGAVVVLAAAIAGLGEALTGLLATVCFGLALTLLIRAALAADRAARAVVERQAD